MDDDDKKIGILAEYKCGYCQTVFKHRARKGFGEGGVHVVLGCDRPNG